MRFLFSFLIVLLFPLVHIAQENGTITDLLNEGRNKLYSQPEQTGKIAEYIISQKENPSTNAETMLLLAKSFYVRGNFNEASQKALVAKKLADASKDLEIKVETSIFAIQLLRELGLETVANNYLKELNLHKKKFIDEKRSLWLDGKLKQDSAYVHSQQENFSKAKQLLDAALPIFIKQKDTIAITATNIALSEAFMKTTQPDSAKMNLEKTLQVFQKNKRYDFQKLQILEELGNFYFSEKNYSKSLEIYQQALFIALKLNNKHYENECIAGLSVNYLALEDAHNFYVNKQKANNISIEVENDKNLAVNGVFNFINTSEKEFSEQKVHQGYLWLYILAGLFLLILIAGIIINHIYISKAKEYSAIWKYIQPKEPILKTIAVKDALEKSSIVPEEIETVLLQKLQKFEAGKRFTNPDMSIALLASQFDTNTKYLSEVINRQKEKNFNSYINELRINYIIEKLKTDSVYFNYKISYLAEESGFSSHSSFATVFKSITGISPTKFMDYLQQRKETA